MKQFEIPLLSKTYIDADSLLLKYLVNACEKMVHHPDGLAGIKAEDLQEFEIIQPQIYVADIASGDQFFGSLEQKNLLLEKLPETYCVEMEGAAVAQVCFEYDIPFCIVRTISDSADHEAHLDFPKFLKTVSGKFSTNIVQEFFNQFSYENQSANR